MIPLEVLYIGHLELIRSNAFLEGIEIPPDVRLHIVNFSLEGHLAGSNCLNECYKLQGLRRRGELPVWPC